MAEAEDEAVARYLREQAKSNERSWSQQAAFMLKCAMLVATEEQG